MKFISEKTQLLKAINSVINGISSKRDTILEGILIQTLDNSIKFNTYNEEIGIEYTINANIVEKGSTVIKFNDNFAPTLAVGTHKLVFEFTTGKIETSLTMVKKDDVPSDNNNNNNNNNDNINRPNHKPNNKIDNNKNKNKLVKTGIPNSSILLFALSAILLGTLTIRKRVKK